MPPPGRNRTLATLFNYACHPTTLAWENRLLSPDYIGAAREVLETRVRAPGALPPGRLGRARAAGRLRRRPGRRRPERPPARPRRGGRDRGAPAARHALRLTGIVASGANLGTWGYRPCEPEQLAAAAQLEAVRTGVDLARKEDLGVVESLSSSTPDSPQEREKALRREFLRLALGDGPAHAMPLWAWRLGEALLVAVGNEPYSVFQSELRGASRARRSSS